MATLLDDKKETYAVFYKPAPTIDHSLSLSVFAGIADSGIPTHPKKSLRINRFSNNYKSLKFPCPITPF